MKNKHAQELGKLGGQATKKKYGKAHYLKLAEHMNKVRESKKLCQHEGDKTNNHPQFCLKCGKEFAYDDLLTYLSNRET